jgi:uncharacterized protein YjbI with pentapeptide repeats
LHSIRNLSNSRSKRIKAPVFTGAFFYYMDRHLRLPQDSGSRGTHTIRHFSLFLILSVGLLLLTSCGSGRTSGSTYTELQLAADPTLRLNPADLAVHFLEASDATSVTSHTDTDLGVETIPYTYSNTTDQTFTLDETDATTRIESVVMMQGETEIFRLDANNLTTTLTLEAGDYDVIITAHADYTVASLGGYDHVVLFSYPREVSQGDLTSDLRSLLATGGQSNDSIDTIYSTKSCEKCNFFKVEFVDAHLDGVNLKSASFRSSKFEGTTITNSDFTGADMIGIEVVNSEWRSNNFTNVNFGALWSFGSELSGNNFTNANLKESKIQFGSIFSNDYHNANLRMIRIYDCPNGYYFIDQNNFTGADLSGASICGFRLCATPSISTCVRK